MNKVILAIVTIIPYNDDGATSDLYICLPNCRYSYNAALPTRLTDQIFDFIFTSDGRSISFVNKSLIIEVYNENLVSDLVQIVNSIKVM